MAAGKRNKSTVPVGGSEQTISIKILDAGMNEEQAWAHVAGWIGPEDHPYRWVEDRTSIVFQFELDSLRVEAAQGGLPYEITVAPDWTSRIRLLEPRDEDDIWAKLAELRRAAPEAVVEEATSRVLRRLVEIEQRDPAEIGLELAETDRTE